MSTGFRSELRKAFYEISLDLLASSPGDGWRKVLVNAGLMILGAVAVASLGRLILGDHWVVYWVLPVLGAWLCQYALHLLAAGRKEQG